MDINEAREKITDESQKIGSSLAVFVEVYKSGKNKICSFTLAEIRENPDAIKGIMEELENSSY